MTTIQITCSHQTALIPMQGDVTVEKVEGIVCPDAVVSEIDLTLVKNYRTKVADHLYHLYMSEATPSGIVELVLTLDAEVIDRVDANLDQIEDFWSGVLDQIAEVEFKYSFAEVINRMLSLED